VTGDASTRFHSRASELEHQVPPKVSLMTTGARQGIALSPDGRTVAFTGLTENGPAIFLRSLDRFDAVKVAGTEGGFGPFFSPNGQWIGFAADDQLKKLPIGGGTAVFICVITLAAR
jgi:serine/threonine-protein kinase